MKALIVTVMLLSGLHGCSAQPRQASGQQQQSTTMEKFDIERFKTGQSGGHLLIRQRDGSEIEQWESPGNYYLEEVRAAGSSFSTYKLFYYETGRLKMSGRQFFKNKIGEWNSYDAAGNITETIDHSKPYRFGIEQLAEKMRKMGVDILTPGPGVGVLMTDDPKPQYTVLYPVSPLGDASKNAVVVDGISGRTLDQRVLERTKD